MIEVTNLIWLDEFIEKIETKHEVTPEEVEAVLNGKPKIKKMNKGRFRGEHVYRALGQTEAGRHLTVFFIYKRTHQALILSARDMDTKERRQYASK
jgi:uncharacterized DUF497 family protein